MSDSGSADKEVRRLDLPVYPKAFIAAARLIRERDRVFVAMPFDAAHSDVLWRVVRSVCDLHGFNARRADSSVYPNPIVADILDELERAEIVVADLTGLNPNVLYELGISHVRCDSVVLLSQKNEPLPFDLANIRCIFYDLGTRKGQIELGERLGRTLESLRTVGPPILIDGRLERTKLIVKELQTLANLPDEDLSQETVWFSGAFSPFGISSEEPNPPEEEEYQSWLLQERESLLALARRGCLIRGIITPPGASDAPRNARIALGRIECLLRFLESGDDALKNIELAVSPFRQKNLYIIGRICCLEGFKKGIQRGYGLTLRQTGMDAITANTSLYEALFDRLSTDTLMAYGEAGQGDRRETLRQAVISCLQRSAEFLKALCEKS